MEQRVQPLRVWKKHWIALAKAEANLLPWGAGIAALLFFAVKLHLSPLYLPLGLALSIVLTAMAWQFLDWWNDDYVLLCDRVMNVTRLPWQGEKNIEAAFEAIQSISVYQTGFWRRLLGYGDLVIETAGKRAIYWQYIPHPNGVKEAIHQAQEAFILAQKREEQEALYEAVRRGMEEALLKMSGVM